MPKRSDKLTLLGKRVRQPVRKLESFEAPPDVSVVSLSTGEFTSLCPITGQPDFQELEIEYVPNELCLESKSLKLYLWSFREEGAFCEALSSRIAHDVFDAIYPESIRVTIIQRPRGGIAIRATTFLPDPSNLLKSFAKGGSE